MRVQLAGSILLVMFFAAPVPAQEAAAGKLVTLDILVADVPAGVAATPTAAGILELEKAGKLSGAARYRLSGLENQQASIQFGEQTPIVSGRNIRGNPGGFGGNAPVSMASYTQVSVGTQLTTVSRVESADTVVTDLKLQRSSVAPQQADPADANTPPQGTLLLNVQATVRTKPGEPLLVSGRQVGSGKDATQTWVVLTASVSASPVVEKPAAAAVGERTIKIIQLAHATAPAMAQVLMETLTTRHMTVAVDQRTNSLILQGEPGTLETARALIERLDSK